MDCITLRLVCGSTDRLKRRQCFVGRQILATFVVLSLTAAALFRLRSTQSMHLWIMKILIMEVIKVSN